MRFCFLLSMIALQTAILFSIIQEGICTRSSLQTDLTVSSRYGNPIKNRIFRQVKEKAEELEDPTISKNGLHHILEQCGATEDDLNAFDREFPDNVVLHSNSIIDTRKCTISAYGMTLKIDRDQLDLLETRNIDGQTYLCIPITNNFRVNDVEIKG